MEKLLEKFQEIWWHIPVIMGMIFVYGFLLNRVLFRPVQRVLEERKKRVQESEALSQHSRDELKNRFAEYEQAVLEAHRRGTHVKEEARAQALEYRGKILGEMKAELAGESAKGEAALNDDVEAVKKDLSDQMPAYAREIASKVLGREMSA